VRATRRLLIVSIAGVALASAAVLGSSAAGGRGSGQPAELFSVDALTASNGWAVGDKFPDPSDYGDYFTATLHQKGSRWVRVGSPNPSAYKAALYGVDAVSSTNVWAVGEYNARNGNDYTLIEQWGGGKWRIVHSPNPGQFGNGLASVSAVSANYIWAVGYYGPPKTIIARWRGGGWKLVKSQDPGAGNGNVLLGVSALSKSNAWAVGYYLTNHVPHVLIEHWNGGSWQLQQGVDPSSTDNELSSVKALSANDVWAVGYSSDGQGDHPLIEHWDGAGWKQMNAPGLPGQGALQSVSGTGPNDVWAVGSMGGGATKTLVVHWDGVAWTRIASPSPSNNENALLGVSARGPSDVWAVGYYNASSGHRSLIEHWNGTSWSVR